MKADDPRHGTSAGYVAGCHSACCWQAKQRYDKRRRWEARQGFARKVSSVGSIRRVQALRCLGWSVPQIARHAGIAYQQMYDLGRYPTVYMKTHRAIAATYEELLAKQPPRSTTGEKHAVTKSTRTAARNGWAPPNAWLDIDDENEQPDPGYREQNSWQHGQRQDVDPVVVDRILAFDFTLATATSKAEKRAVIAGWQATGRPLKELEDGTGWAVHRYLREMRSEVAS